MAVGVLHALDGRTRHEKSLEHAVLDGGDWAALDALVIVFVPAVQIDSIHLAARGIEHHGKKVRQDLGPHTPGEGLAFAFVLLSMALNAMAENFMEEHTRSAAREDGRADEGFGFGRA